MRGTSKLIVTIAVGGLVTAGASAFTATSTIDKSAINVGSVAQSISGATITNVVHTYTAATDTTTALTAKAEQLLSTASGVVTVSVNGGSAQSCSVALTDAAPLGTDGGADDYSTLSCDITDVADVTSLRFVVNG